MSQEHGAKPQHPLIAHGELPEWLSHVAMSADKPVLIPFDQEKAVPLRLVLHSLDARVGTTCGEMPIAPELAQLFTQLTENTGWMNLVAEPTTIERVAEDTWVVEVGDYSQTFTRDGLSQHVRNALEPQIEK